MRYGILTPEQKESLKPYLEEAKDLLDLGCGDLSLTYQLVDLGASDVTGVDLRAQKVRPEYQGKVKFLKKPFSKLDFIPDIAFVSWPYNSTEMGLLKLVQKSRQVIYLGKNTDTIACGFPDFYKHLSKREVLAHVPNKYNTLIVYGPQYCIRRCLPEEFAGIHINTCWDYKELHGKPLPYA